MWELDCEESWAPKNWCFRTVVLEKTLESPMNCKEIQPVHSKGDQSWVFFGRTDAEAATPILWPPHEKSWLIGKVPPDAGRMRWLDARGWDGWMESLTRWTWVWVNSGSWWWTGRHGMLRFMGSQRVGRNWVSELNWKEKALPMPLGTGITEQLSPKKPSHILFWLYINSVQSLSPVQLCDPMDCITIHSLNYFYTYLEILA